MAEADKARLDRLQAEIVARTGRRLSQQDLLSRLVDLGREQLDRVADIAAPPDPRALDRLMRLPVKSGKHTRADKVDAEIYKVDW